MAEVITITELILLIVIETYLYNRDVNRHEREMRKCRAENERLQAENKKLRGESIVKEATKYSEECK